MRMLSVVARGLAIVTLGLIAWANPAHATITGFGDFSGFQINKKDGGANPAVNFSPSVIHLTGADFNEARSIFFKTPQPTSSFSASFTYLATGNNYVGQGFAFLLQNDVRGAEAVGDNNNFLAYNGISPSTAIKFSPNTALPIGLFANGAVGNGTNGLGPIDLLAGHPINVALDYNGTILTTVLTDTVTLQSSPAASFLVTLPATAYVGLTASTNSGIDQAFSNFTFTNAVPEPPAAILFAAGAVGIVVYLRHRRAGGRNSTMATQS